MDGYMIHVDVDEQAVRVHGNNKAARIALAGQDHGAGDVVIPRGEIREATYRGANPLVNGHLTIVTTGGQRYQLHFRRKQQPDFEQLARELGAV